MALIVNASPQVTVIGNLDDLKVFLGVETDNDDPFLTQMLNAATPVIEHLCGPIIPRQVTDELDSTGAVLVLPSAPVLTVDSVTEWTTTGTTLAAFVRGSGVPGYRLKAEAGLLTRVDGYGSPCRWGGAYACGSGNIEVTYTVGRNPIPANIIEATYELVAEWWANRRGGSKSFGLNTDMIPPTSYGVPNRVTRILAGSLRAPTVG